MRKACPAIFPLDLLGAGPIIREALDHGMVLHG